MPSTLAIVGSRALAPDLTALLGAPSPGTVIVSGGAGGVDAAAAAYAHRHGVALLELRPDYATWRRRAPLVRNAEIARRCDRLIAVWDGQSRGTLHTMRTARRLGRPVRLIVLRAGRVVRDTEEVPAHV